VQGRAPFLFDPTVLPPKAGGIPRALEPSSNNNGVIFLQRVVVSEVLVNQAVPSVFGLRVPRFLIQAFQADILHNLLRVHGCVFHTCWSSGGVQNRQRTREKCLSVTGPAFLARLPSGHIVMLNLGAHCASHTVRNRVLFRPFASS